MAQYFISYSRENQIIVERLRRDLQNAGIDIWIDSVGLQPGTPDWDEALRVAIKASEAVILLASPSSRRSAYVRDEIALAKDAQKPIYPVWVDGDKWMDSIPMGLGSTQNVDLREENYAKNLTSLIGALNGKVTEDLTIVEPVLPEPPVKPVENPRNPYKGLRAFHEEDSDDFFGRSLLIDDLLNAIEDEKQSARLLAVLGASGSGKSSVMMAGVLPKLRQNHPDWIFLDPIVPSANPLEKLTIALARQLPQKSHSGIREDLLDRSTRGLHRLTCELSDKPVVLYIDQFEEVFTLIEKEPERRQFIDLITTAVNEPDGVLIVLLSMRADFYDRPAQYREFGTLIEKQHVLITPMTLADLYDVVQLPAQLPDVGMSFDEGLVTEMVFAVREEAAALPLLQFTLDQLFQRREGNILTNSAYQAIGGVQGALAQHAEATFNNLPSDQHKTLARALFLRLIEARQTEQDTTRRRATFSELTLPDVEQTRILQATADAFVNARLLVTDQSGDNRTIEVSHEALIREWQRLGDWLRDAREDLRLQKSLSADVAEWLRRSKSDDMLYRGIVLIEAENWLERNVASEEETEFIEKAFAFAQKQKITDAARRKSEEQYQLLVKNLPNISLLLIDRDMHHLLAEGGGLAKLGYTKEIIENKTISDVFPPYIVDELNPYYQAVFDESSNLTDEIEIDGYHFEVNIIPITNDDAKIEAGIIFLQDITERKQIEQQAITLQLEQERTGILSQFITNASHELQTPLSIIMTSLYLIRKTKDEAKVGTYLDRIEGQSRRLNEVVQELLNKTRLDNKPQLKIEPVEIKPVIDNLVNMINSDNAPAILVEIQPNLPLLVADGGQIERALGNILSNAVQHTPVEGRIDIQVYQEHNSINIEIKDTGRGIAPENLSRIFESFFRTGVSGLGLGLATTKQIIDLHSGTIQVESEVDKQTTFKISLPLDQD